MIGGAAGARRSPYQGLTPFDEADAEYFFGRERDARLICADLFAAPLSVLYGASGVGKSSLLRAGLMPLLRSRNDLLPLVFAEWQSDPIEALKKSVLRALPNFTVDPSQNLADFLRECAIVSRRRLMIVFDQFEEYSLYHPSNDDPFAQQFPQATTLPDLSVSFLISLREEAVARLDRFEGRIPALFDNLRRIHHIDEKAARDAIELPLQKFTNGEVSAEPELVTAVIEEVRTGRVHLGESGRGTTDETGGSIEAPYLQLVMTRIWQEERAESSPLLRSATLSRLGGAPKIVQAHLDAVMQELTDEQRDIAARVFQQLVTPSGTKIAHSAHDLAAYAGVDLEKLRWILETLSRGDGRILRPVAELPDQPGKPRYEIFHDRLAPAILDWRSRQMKATQVAQANEQQDAEREYQARLLQSLIRLLLDNVSPAERATAHRILSAFVSPSGSRLAVSREDVKKWTDADANVVPLLRKLARGAILRDEERPEGTFLELAHDAVVEPLLEWLGLYRQAATAPRHSGLVSPQVTIDQRAIADALKEGRIVVVLGSGASASNRPDDEAWTSASSFLPKGTELQRLMASRANFPSEELERASFSEVASYFAVKRGRRDLDRLLAEIFDRTYPLPLVHRLLAEVARATPLLILTTTFDTLMEHALVRAGVAFRMAHSTLERSRPLIWYGTPVTYNDLPPAGETVVYKMFGSPPRYLATEEEDMELFAQMVDGRVPPPAIRAALARNHVLFLGMGLSAWPQRLMLRQLRENAVTQSSSRGWAIVKGLGTSDRTRWAAAEVEPFDESIDVFARGLAKRLGIAVQSSE